MCSASSRSSAYELEREGERALDEAAVVGRQQGREVDVADRRGQVAVEHPHHLLRRDAVGDQAGDEGAGAGADVDVELVHGRVRGQQVDRPQGADLVDAAGEPAAAEHQGRLRRPAAPAPAARAVALARRLRNRRPCPSPGGLFQSVRWYRPIRMIVPTPAPPARRRRRAGRRDRSERLRARSLGLGAPLGARRRPRRGRWLERRLGLRRRRERRRTAVRQRRRQAPDPGLEREAVHHRRVPRRARPEGEAADARLRRRQALRPAAHDARRATW